MCSVSKVEGRGLALDRDDLNGVSLNDEDSARLQTHFIGAKVKVLMRFCCFEQTLTTNRLE